MEKGVVMKLSNEELLRVSDPSVPQEIKDFLCKSKMTEDELKICRNTGCSLSDYMIQKTVNE